MKIKLTHQQLKSSCKRWFRFCKCWSSYVNVGPVLVTRSKDVNHFPIPVVLKKRGSGETYGNYAQNLCERGLAKFGELDLSNPKFSQHARGIDAA